MTETLVDIKYLNNEAYPRFAYYLEFVKENSRSIYAESPLYGWIYRIEKSTKKVFMDGKQIGSDCEYYVY